MKKLMIAFAAVAMAASVNAATVAWKIANANTYNTADTAITTGQSDKANYLILCVYSADATQDIGLSTGTVSYGDDAKVGTTGITAKGGTGTVTGFKPTYDYSSGYYYYAIIYSSKGNVSESNYDWYATSATLGPGQPDSGKTAETETPLSLSWTSASAGWNTWNQVAAVPEPTSGLLLLIGVAGLALRRRRA